jgi:hypothetical protein
MWEYHAFLATNDDTKASVDWANYSHPFDASNVIVSLTAFTASHPITDHLEDCHFAFNTAATCHISPKRSDFKTLYHIPNHPIKGLGDTCVYAIGIGTIGLCMAAGHTLTLQNILFVPASTICLLSVLTLNHSGWFTTHFNSNLCWVTNQSGATVACGCVSHERELYFLTAKTVRVTYKYSSSVSAFFSSSPVPDIETWHHHLGHYSIRTVVDMAQNHIVACVTANLFCVPPKCNHCILGKQMRMLVPKTHSHPKSSTPLEKVFVDLCGPMSVTSRSGRLYSMNVIDDFSGYVWSLPLRHKSDAAMALQAWATAVQTQLGHKLRQLVTNNGKLISKTMSAWCSMQGVTHLLTAPHTSAQNRCAE